MPAPVTVKYMEENLDTTNPPKADIFCQSLGHSLYWGSTVTTLFFFSSEQCQGCQSCVPKCIGPKGDRVGTEAFTGVFQFH